MMGKKDGIQRRKLPHKDDRIDRIFTKSKKKKQRMMNPLNDGWMDRKKGKTKKKISISIKMKKEWNDEPTSWIREIARRSIP